MRAVFSAGAAAASDGGRAHARARTSICPAKTVASLRSVRGAQACSNERVRHTPPHARTVHARCSPPDRVDPRDVTGGGGARGSGGEQPARLAAGARLNGRRGAGGRGARGERGTHQCDPTRRGIRCRCVRSPGLDLAGPRLGIGSLRTGNVQPSADLGQLARRSLGGKRTRRIPYHPAHGHHRALQCRWTTCVAHAQATGACVGRTTRKLLNEEAYPAKKPPEKRAALRKRAKRIPAVGMLTCRAPS